MDTVASSLDFALALNGVVSEWHVTYGVRLRCSLPVPVLCHYSSLLFSWNGELSSGLSGAGLDQVGLSAGRSCVRLPCLSTRMSL